MLVIEGETFFWYTLGSEVFFSTYH